MGRHHVLPKYSAKPLLASLASVSLIAATFSYFTAVTPVHPTVIAAAIIPAPLETITPELTTTETTPAPIVDLPSVTHSSETKPPNATTRPPERLAPPSPPAPVVRTSVVNRPIPTTTQAPPKPLPKPPPPPPVIPTPKSVEPGGGDLPFRTRVADIAKSYVGAGIPYVYGGKSLTSGADCSYFVTAVLNKAGVNTPYRTSDGFVAWTARVKTPLAGDLVLFSGHIGIFVGDGMMVDHGSGLGAKLREIKWFDDFIGYGRIPL